MLLIQAEWGASQSHSGQLCGCPMSLDLASFFGIVWVMICSKKSSLVIRWRNLFRWRKKRVRKLSPMLVLWHMEGKESVYLWRSGVVRVNTKITLPEFYFYFFSIGLPKKFSSFSFFYFFLLWSRDFSRADSLSSLRSWLLAFCSGTILFFSPFVPRPPSSFQVFLYQHSSLHWCCICMLFFFFPSWSVYLYAVLAHQKLVQKTKCI